MRELSAILELDGHFRGKDVERYLRAININLPCSNLGDFPILYIATDSNAIENGCTVPCFGHNYLCERKGGCHDPRPYSVRRYFGLSLYVEGEPTSDILGDYEIPDGRLVVCGIAAPRHSVNDATRKELERL